MKTYYWLYIEPYSLISIKSSNMLIFNLIDGKYIEYKNNNKINNLARRLKMKKNQRVVKISNSEYKTPVINEFITKLKASNLGDIVKGQEIGSKPFLTPPLLNVYSEVYRKNEEMKFAFGRNVLNNLHEVSFFINSQMKFDLQELKEGYKQFLMNYVSEDPSELSFDLMKKSIHELSNSSVYKINILGGNIFSYKDLGNLVKLLNSIPARKSYYIYFTQLNNISNTNFQILNSINESDVLKAFISFPIDQKTLNSFFKQLSKLNIKKEITFVVKSELDLSKANDIVSTHQIDIYKIKPFFNANNFNFFKRNVLLTKNEILGLETNQHENFIKQVINPLYFGKLTILSDRSIFSNLNSNRIGRLGKDTFHDVVFRELLYGRSWRKLRKNVSPCSKCVLNLLCPPISNYEYVIKKNDLCLVNNK